MAENLERKTRRFGWREVVGGVAVAGAVAAASIYGAHHFYNKGREHERRNIAAEAQENNSAVVWMGGPEEEGRFDVGIHRVDEQGRKLIYLASATPAPYESIRVEAQGGFTTFIDGSRLLDFAPGGTLDVNAEHDGLVDVINKCSGGKCTTLVRGEAMACDGNNANCAPRASDYEAHKAEFDEADAEFWRLKARMSYI